MLSKLLQKELAESGWIHMPLPLHEENSLEAVCARKPVLASHAVWEGEENAEWRSTGRGEVTVLRDEDLGKNILRLEAKTVYDCFPDGLPAYAQYTNFGRLQAFMPVDREDWSAFNRITFRIRPDYPARKHVTCIAAVVNDGSVKVPDVYHREGYHVINLLNHEWNTVNWEFPDLPRDCVTGVYLYTFLNGDNDESGDYIRFDFESIRLEKIEEPERVIGWQGNANRIFYATAGYDAKGAKSAVSTAEAETFSVLNEKDEVVLSKRAVLLQNKKGTFRVLDFSELSEEGMYRLRSGEAETPLFPVSKTVFDSAVLKSINFLFSERCGYPVLGVHGGCHFDAYAEWNGRKAVYCGGWHDAGDMSQQTLQSAEITHAILMNVRCAKDPMIRARLLEEANWGIDFILRTRFGNGWHATSAGMTRYTDNKTGTFDDIPDVRVGDPAFDNFLYGGILADAAAVLTGEYAGRAESCIRAAEEDFAAALARYRAHGVERPVQEHEHTYPTGRSGYFAAACWGASRLFAYTKKEEYAAAAREFGRLLIACQEAGEAGIGLTGFFYREEEHRYVVHFSHQSREHLFMQALCSLAQTQPDHEERSLWDGAIRRYGEYVKTIFAETAPYGMIPAGVYHEDEGENEELFRYNNMGSKYEWEKPNYRPQVHAGRPLGNGFYLRCFPVWFSFRGNAAVTLSAGTGAAIAGRYLKDETLLQVGREQLYWTLGKNPFGQSIMYGEGMRYPQLYATSSGELCGELPVGIESYGNEDVPYWPQGNNCTYKEIWTSPTGRFLWLTAIVSE
ncbi:MAG: glycoside hydrolase family 9 protein [Oscillospiraceae bacterium]|nr:glycoside hydrolase family 9 protein [Oscillospiraceae bacterium]MDY3064502.1 glycoside hydrolase family 9 protein [Oscillospiraceae bacterium]